MEKERISKEKCKKDILIETIPRERRERREIYTMSSMRVKPFFIEIVVQNLENHP